MKESKKSIIAFLISLSIIFTNAPCFAQSSAREKINREPEPYGIDEFQTWQKDLRRFEIISFGALPFVTLLSFWSYDIIRSIQHRGDPAYNAWPLKRNDIAKPLTEDEQKKVFFAALGISVGVALIDFSYRAIKREIERKKLEEELRISGEAIQLLEFEEEEPADDGSAKK